MEPVKIIGADGVPPLRTRDAASEIALDHERRLAVCVTRQDEAPADVPPPRIASDSKDE